MYTWEDYKKEAKARNPQTKADLERIEMIVEIIATIVEKRNELGYSQRDLAKLCELPQSSIARIEAFLVDPKLDTLIKIMNPLGLKLSVVSA